MTLDSNIDSIVSVMIIWSGVCDVESSTINLKWGQVNCSHRNGIILGYTVLYEVVGSGNIQYLNVSARSTVGSINELFFLFYRSLSQSSLTTAM